MDRIELLTEYHKFLVESGRIILPETTSIDRSIQEFNLKSKSITLREFIDMSQSEMSVRLYNVLYHGGYNLDRTHVNDLSLWNLRRMRNFGSKCANEFIELRIKYLGE